MRKELVEAYQSSAGGHGIERKGDEPEILGVVKQNIPQPELENFNVHGLANITLPADNFAKIAFIIDTEGISDHLSGYWLTQGQKQMILHLSDGKQSKPETATDLDTKRHLHGFYIITTGLSRGGINNAYTAKVIPLYSPRVEQAHELSAQLAAN